MFVYEQSNGRLVLTGRNGPELIGLGYAGAPPCLNDPDKDHVKGCGPLPRGQYRLIERRHPRFASPAFALEPKRAPIREGVWSEGSGWLYGRGGFWIHGDNAKRNRSASSGCIVLDRKARIRIRLALQAGALPLLTVDR